MAVNEKVDQAAGSDCNRLKCSKIRYKRCTNTVFRVNQDIPCEHPVGVPANGFLCEDYEKKLFCSPFVRISH